MDNDKNYDAKKEANRLLAKYGSLIPDTEEDYTEAISSEQEKSTPKDPSSEDLYKKFYGGQATGAGKKEAPKQSQPKEEQAQPQSQRNNVVQDPPSEREQEYFGLANERQQLERERGQLKKEGTGVNYDEIRDISGRLKVIESDINELKPKGAGVRLVNAFNGFVQGASEVPVGLLQGIATTAKWMDNAAGTDFQPGDVDEQTLFIAGQKLRDLAHKYFETDPVLMEEFTQQLSMGMGSFASFGVGGWLSRLLTGTVRGGQIFAVGSAGFGGSANAYQEAKDNNASEADAQLASKWGFLPGVVQVSNTALRVLNRWDRAYGGRLKESMARKVLEAGKSGINEALVESLGQAGFNAIAKEIHDAERPYTEGLFESGSVGGTAGFLSDLILTGLGGKAARMRGKNQQRKRDVEDNREALELEIQNREDIEVGKYEDQDVVIKGYDSSGDPYIEINGEQKLVDKELVTDIDVITGEEQVQAELANRNDISEEASQEEAERIEGETIVDPATGDYLAPGDQGYDEARAAIEELSNKKSVLTVGKGNKQRNLNLRQHPDGSFSVEGVQIEGKDGEMTVGTLDQFNNAEIDQIVEDIAQELDGPDSNYEIAAVPVDRTDPFSPMEIFIADIDSQLGSQLKQEKAVQQYEVQADGTELKVINPDGKEVSKQSKYYLPVVTDYFKASADQYANMETVTDDNENVTPENYTDEVARYSENPVELSEAYLMELGNQENDMEGSSKQIAIAEDLAMSRIPSSDLRSRGLDGQMYYAQYASKQADTDLAQRAEYLSDQTGQDITVDDIMDFIRENPGGPKSALNNMKSEKVTALEAKFKEVTGIDISKVLAESISGSVTGSYGDVGFVEPDIDVARQQELESLSDAELSELENKLLEQGIQREEIERINRQTETTTEQEIEDAETAVENAESEAEALQQLEDFFERQSQKDNEGEAGSGFLDILDEREATPVEAEVEGAPEQTETTEGSDAVTDDAETESNERIVSAVIRLNDGAIIEGATHGEAINKAVDDGLMSEEDSDGRGNVNIDLFKTSEGRIIDRFVASREFGIASAEKIDAQPESTPEAQTGDSDVVRVEDPVNEDGKTLPDAQTGNEQTGDSALEAEFAKDGWRKSIIKARQLANDIGRTESMQDSWTDLDGLVSAIEAEMASRQESTQDNVDDSQDNTVTDSRSDELSDQADAKKAELKKLFEEFDDLSSGQLNLGLDPKLIVKSGQIMKAGAELGYIRFQQLANFVIENMGEDAWKRIFTNFKAAYTANTAMEGNPNNEDLNEIAKSKAEDFITEQEAEPVQDTTDSSPKAILDIRDLPVQKQNLDQDDQNRIPKVGSGETFFIVNQNGLNRGENSDYRVANSVEEAYNFALNADQELYQVWAMNDGKIIGYSEASLFEDYSGDLYENGVLKNDVKEHAQRLLSNDLNVPTADESTDAVTDDTISDEMENPNPTPQVVGTQADQVGYDISKAKKRYPFFPTDLLESAVEKINRGHEIMSRVDTTGLPDHMVRQIPLWHKLFAYNGEMPSWGTINRINNRLKAEEKGYKRATDAFKEMTAENIERFTEQVSTDYSVSDSNIEQANRVADSLRQEWAEKQVEMRERAQENEARQQKVEPAKKALANDSELHELLDKVYGTTGVRPQVNNDFYDGITDGLFSIQDIKDAANAMMIAKNSDNLLYNDGEVNGKEIAKIAELGVESFTELLARSGKPSARNAIDGIIYDYLKAGLIDNAHYGNIVTKFDVQDLRSENDEQGEAEEGITEVETLFMEDIKQKITSKDAMTKAQLDKLAKDRGITSQKRIKELAELAIIDLARGFATSEIDVQLAYGHMVNIYENQPNLTGRTSTSIMLQQYSTPVPFSYMMGVYTNIDDGVAGFEPSAGNGMLTIAAGRKPSNIISNEIDSDRLQMLRQQGFHAVMSQDGTIGFDAYAESQQAMLTNPPFGKTDARFNYEIDGRQGEMTKLEHVMSAKALETLRDDGKAAILIGGNDTFNDNGNRSGQDAVFFHWLYHNYNVEDVINIAGSMYKKQGASFPTRIILINKRKPIPTGFAPSQTEGVEVVSSFEEFYKRIQPKLTRPNHERITQAELDSGSTSGESVSDPSGESGQPTDLFGNPIETQGGTDGVGGTGTQGESDGTGSPTGTGSGTGTRGQSSDDSRGTDGQRPVQDGNRRSETEDGRSAQNEESNEQRRVERDLPTEKSTIRDRVTADDILEANNGNIVYSPLSDSGTMTTEVPASMSLSMQKTLENLADQVNNVDAFLMEKLGYDRKADLYEALAAEQIDAVALAIQQVQRGKALIVGDQTGIGKGRVAASMIRYAINEGITPVFFTEKDNLFSDMHRDITDIGSNYKPFIVNNNVKITDADGKVVYRSEKKSAHNRVLKNPELVSNYDYVAITYSQIQNLNSTTKRNFIESLASNSMIIMDESHNASGSSNTGEFFISLLPETKGAIYLSATFAKRPDNFPVYAVKTDISDVAMNSDEMIEAIESGGVALQEILSSDLVESGQMVRRQRSFKGVKREFEIVGTNDQGVLNESGVKQRELYDQVSEVMRDIIKFQETIVANVISEMDRDVKENALEVVGKKGVKKAGVDNPPFVSRIHNIVDQVLFSIKVDAVADEAIRILESNRKPIVAVKSTMEAILDDTFGTGESVDGLNFGIVMERALKSVMKYSVKDGITGDSTPGQLTRDDLDAMGRRVYDNIVKKASEITEELSPSPIDHLINRLQSAGYRIGEVTGRSRKIDLNEDGTGVVMNRTKKEKDKTTLYREFNEGGLDGLIINSSGATGASAHASEKFGDQRQRVMIIHQPELNINTEVQKWGRIFRTGQVVLPEYKYITSSIPAETRLMMVLKRKIKSLDANTTSSQDTSSEFLGMSDFMNKYGDYVVTQYLKDNESLHNRLQKPIADATYESVKDGTVEAVENISMKASGRIALLESEVQENFYETISEQYQNYIDMLNEYGENELVMDNVDLQAETTEKNLLVKGDKPDTLFGGNSYLEKVNARVLKKPMKKDEIESIVAEELGEESASDYQDRHANEADAYIDNWLAEQTAEINARDADEDAKAESQDRANEKAEQWKRNTSKKLFSRFKPGMVYVIPADSQGKSGMTKNAVFVGFSINENARNPYAPSSIKLTFITNDAQRSVNIPGSNLPFLNAAAADTMHLSEYARKEIFNKWNDNLNTRNFEERYIATGNILQALGSLGTKGQLIQYTTNEGDVRNGVLLPRNMKDQDLKKLKNVRVRAVEAEQQIFDLSEGYSIEMTGSVVFRRGWDGNIHFVVPSSNVKGARYFTDEKLLDMLGDFVKSGAEMRVQVDATDVGKLLRDLTERFNIYAEVPLDSVNDDTKTRIDERPYSDILTDTEVDFSATGKSHRQNIRDAVNEITSKWASSDFVNVVDTVQDLPVSLSKKFIREGIDGKVTGVYSGNQIYMVSDNIRNVSEARKTLFHEAFGHMGLRSLVSNLSYNRKDFEGRLHSILNGVYNSFKDDALMKRIAENYGYDMRKPEDKLAAAEEFISITAETKVSPTIWDRLVKLINDLMKYVGISDTQYTRGDLMNLIARSKEHIEGYNVGVVRTDRDGNAISTFQTIGERFQKGDGFIAENFRSMAYDGLNRIDQGAATTDQWMKMIADRGGKGTAQELEWIGLEDFLNGYMKTNDVKSVPKEVVRDYINDNRIQIEEVVLGSRQGQYFNMQDYHLFPDAVTAIMDKHDDDVDAIANDLQDLGYKVSMSPSGVINSFEKPIATREVTPDNVTGVTQTDLDWVVKFDNGESVNAEKGFFETEQEAIDYAVDHFNENPDAYNLQPIPDGAPKYGEYTLPGGENYREILLTLPVGRNPNERALRRHREEKQRGNHAAAERILEDAGINAPVYNSSHFDQPNILAHVRVKDRYLENGEKVLFIEELQSDWAQEGRKEGFKPTKKQAKELEEKRLEFVRALNRSVAHWELNSNNMDISIPALRSEDSEMDRLMIDREKKEKIYNDLRSQYGSVADNPYKQTDQWAGMAIRRMLAMATEGNYDRIGWITGEQAVDMYDLSKRIDRIDHLYNAVDPDKGTNVDIYLSKTGPINLQVKSDGTITSKRGYTGVTIQEGSNLADVIGKDLAKKVLDLDYGDSLSGDGLKVGGDGMKTFYNKIVPKVARNEAKRFDKGMKVEVIDMPDTGEVGPSQQLSIRLSNDGRESLTDALPLFRLNEEDSSVQEGEIIQYDAESERIAFGEGGADAAREQLVQELREGLAPEQLTMDFDAPAEGTADDILSVPDSVSDSEGLVYRRAVLDSFEESGKVDFIGQQIESSQDIADLYSIHRSPLIEKFHIVGLDADQKIVYQTAVTSNASNYVRVDNMFSEQALRGIEKSGATSVVMIHNHPSGNPRASNEDIVLTKRWAKITKELTQNENTDFNATLSQHIVMNGNEFSVIKPDGSTHKRKYKKPVTDFYKDLRSQKNYGDPNALYEFGKQLVGPDNKSFVYMNNQNQIIGYDSFPVDATAEEVNKAFENAKKEIGIGRVIMVGPDGLLDAEMNSRYSFNLLDAIEIKSKPGGRSIYRSARNSGLLMTSMNHRSTSLNAEEKRKLLWEPKATYKSMPEIESIDGVRVEDVKTRLQSGDRLEDHGFAYQQRFDKITRIIQNSGIAAKRMVEGVTKDGGKVTDQSNFYQDETLARGRTGTRLDEFNKGIRKELIASAQKANKEAGITHDDLHKYLYARHAEEANDYLFEQNPDGGTSQSGMSTEEANTILKRVDDNHWQEYMDEFAGVIDQIHQENLLNQVAYGLISRQRYGALKKMFDHYVPLRGFEDFMDVDPTMYTPDVSRKGRSSKAGDTIAYTLAMYESTIIRGERNLVKQKVLKFAEENNDRTDLLEIENVYWLDTGQTDPDTGRRKYIAQFDKPSAEDLLTGKVVREINPDTGVGKWEEADNPFQDNRVKIMVDGRVVSVRFKDPHIAEWINGTDKESMSIVTKILPKYMSFLRNAYITYSPEFPIRNLFRDGTTGAVHIATDFNTVTAAAIGNPLRLIKNSMPAMWKAIHNQNYEGEWGSAAKKFLARGAISGYYQLSPMKRITKDLQRDIEKHGKAWYKTKNGLKRFGQLMESYTSTVENAIRLSAFKYFLDNKVVDPKTGKPFTEKGAALYAKDLTVNFNRKGSSGPNIGSFYIFFNSSIQGIARQAEPFFQGGNRRKARAAAVPLIMGGAAYFMTDMIRLLMGVDEDDQYKFDKINDFTIAHRLLIPNFWSDNEDSMISIPLPYGLNGYWAAGVYTNKVMNKTMEAGDAAIKMAQVAWQAYNPVGGEISSEGAGYSAFKSAIPTVFIPPFEYVTNRDFRGQPIAPERFPYGPQGPDSENFKFYTSEWAKKTARVLNSVSGGDQYTSGLLDVSPNNLEHLVSSYLGGAGNFGISMLQTVDQMIHHVNGDEKIDADDMRRFPMARIFFSNVPRSAKRTNFVDNSEMIEQLAWKHDQLLQDKGVEQAEAFWSENVDLIELLPLQKRLQSAISRNYDALNNVPEGDQEWADEILEEISRLHSVLNREVNRVRGSAASQNQIQSLRVPGVTPTLEAFNIPTEPKNLTDILEE